MDGADLIGMPFGIYTIRTFWGLWVCLLKLKEANYKNERLEKILLFLLTIYEPLNKNFNF